MFQIDKLIKPLQHKFAGIKHNNGKDMHHWKKRKRWPVTQMARGYKHSPHLYLIHMDYNPSQSSSEEIFWTL